MIDKYRQRPVVVEARRLNEANIVAIERWCGGSIKGTKLPTYKQEIEVHNREYGEMRAAMGDWLVKGTGGGFITCTDEIFQQTYEKI